MSAALRPAAEARLATLRQEIVTGREALTQLEQRRAALTDMLLRIEGAVQVLEEVLATREPAAPSADGTPEEDPCQNPNEAAPTNSR